MSRRAFENIALYLIFVAVYCFQLDILPPKPELFEAWVDLYLPLLDKPWDQMMKEFITIRPNDSNQSVNAPVWLIIIKISLSIFGNSLFAYRLPGVLLTALAPVLTAELVRRFLRKDLALWAGILVGAHQHVIGFARTGGYIGPTLSLLLGIILSASILAFEGRRKAWIPLVLCLAISPFFYATIRYLGMIGAAIVGIKFLTSREFRKHNTIPAACTVVFFAIVAFFLTERANKEVAMMYISARGEQFLLTDKTLAGGNQAASLPPQFQVKGVLTEMVPERMLNVYDFYIRGKRFFNHRHQQMHYDREWRAMQPWLLSLFLLGVARCIFQGISNQRYLIPLGWSILAFLPLLVTTGISPNRMLLGIPADMFMMVLALFIPIDLATRFLPGRWIVVPRAIACGLVLWFSYHSVSVYFADYINYPNL
jgi:4-amino-4-deoxy-L-arabinose transferase-like glycosyltransferase